jgi:hypothetical protein
LNRHHVASSVISPFLLQPEGPTQWVLRQYTRSSPPLTLLIDPCSGRAYFDTDDACPLKSVGMLASPTNCWANTQVRPTCARARGPFLSAPCVGIGDASPCLLDSWLRLNEPLPPIFTQQEFCEPWRIDWDLTDTRYWAPLFGQGASTMGSAPATLSALAELPPVQERALRYTVPDLKTAAALETELQLALSNALRSWRPRYVTRIRGDLTTTLRGLLFELEARALGYAAGPAAVLTSDGPVAVDLSAAAGGRGAGGRGESFMPGSSGMQTPGGMMMGTAAAATLAVSRRGCGWSAPVSRLTTPSFPLHCCQMRDLAGEHQATIERTAHRFRVQGYPLHLPFTDLEGEEGIDRGFLHGT